MPRVFRNTGDGCDRRGSERMSEGETASEVTMFIDEWWAEGNAYDDLDRTHNSTGTVRLNEKSPCQFDAAFTGHRRDWMVDWISTDRGFDAHVRQIVNDTEDPRWKCSVWRSRTEAIMAAFYESVRDDLHLGLDPIVSLRRYFSSKTYVCWRATDFGGAVLTIDNGATDAMCGWCPSCVNSDPIVDGVETATTWSCPAVTNPSVYFIQAIAGGPVKIGRSITPTERLSSLQTGNPMPLRIIATIPGGAFAERALHRAFADDRVKGEWFSPSRELMAFIAEISRKGSAQ